MEKNAENDKRDSLFERLALITGKEAAAAIEKSAVIVVGLGGVGSWCAEALVRSGVGSVSLVDSDTVAASNVNRQAQAAGSTLGRLKTEALAERLLDINPFCNVELFPVFFSKETLAQQLNLQSNLESNIKKADFIIDAIDTIESKLDLIELALAEGKRLFSSMGMAFKLDPTRVKTADIWETSGCPLARMVRQGLRKRKVNGHFTVVYSPERLPMRLHAEQDKGKKVMGSAVPVTATAGMILASLVLRDVCSRFPPAEVLHG